MFLRFYASGKLDGSLSFFYYPLWLTYRDLNKSFFLLLLGSDSLSPAPAPRSCNHSSEELRGGPVKRKQGRRRHASAEVKAQWDSRSLMFENRLLFSFFSTFESRFMTTGHVVQIGFC